MIRKTTLKAIFIDNEPIKDNQKNKWEVLLPLHNQVIKDIRKRNGQQQDDIT